MAKWAEIKCERCAEQDALWEGMERSLEESDAREARLERWLSQSENREATLNDRITMLEEQLCVALEKLDDAEATLAELTGGKDE